MNSILVTRANPLASTVIKDVFDDVLLTIGTDGDNALLNRSTVLNANTALTSVLIGTPVAAAIAANSLMISNVTASGDIALYVNKGGHSQMVFWADSSAADTAIMAGSGGSVDLYIAGTKILDYATGAFAFQQAVTISSTSTLTINAFTLGGAVAGGDQSFTNVGDMTFAAGSILASGSTNGNTLLIKANDTTFITLTTGTTDVCTLNAITMSGTWLASGTVTLPAFTLGGTVLGASQTIETVALWGILSLLMTSSGSISAYSADNAVAILQSRDNAVGLVEIARLVGAADPYIRIGRDDTGVALDAVTDMFYLQAGAGTGNAAANFGFGMPVYLSNAASEQEERASIDFVLTDATNASEDVEINFKLQIAGAATAEVLSIVGTGLDLPTGKVLSVAGTQVIGARIVDDRCDDTLNSGDATTDGVIDALRDAMITHGLIAAA